MEWRDTETYDEVRTKMRIWSEDITTNEAYLAERAFTQGTHEDCKKWGNHLLRILKVKAGMQHQYTPAGTSEAVDL